jgi:hypothetical protein
MSENQAVKAKNIIAKRYAIWGGVFIVLLTSISVIWLFLRFLNLDA